MPKLPRPSGRAMVSFLEGRGFRVVRVRGSHHFLESDEGRTTVPVHGQKTLKIGILRDVGLSAAEFEAAWRI